MRGPTTSSRRGLASQGLASLWSAIVSSVVVCTLMATLVAAVPGAAAPPSQQTLDLSQTIDLSMELTPDGRPIISYVDSDVDELIHVVCDDPACEGPEELLVVAAATSADMTIDSSGRPILVYTNDDGAWLARCGTVGCEGAPEVVDGSRGLGTVPPLPGAISVTALPNGPLRGIEVGLDSEDNPAIIGNFVPAAWRMNRCDDPLCIGDDEWTENFGDIGDSNGVHDFTVDPVDRPVVVNTDGDGRWYRRCDSLACASPTARVFPGPSPGQTRIAYTAEGLPALLSGVTLAQCVDLVCGEISSIEAVFADSRGVALVNRADHFSMVFWNQLSSEIEVQHCLDEACSDFTTGSVPVSGAVEPNPNLMVARFDSNEVLTVAMAGQTGVRVVRCGDGRCRANDLVGVDDDYNATEDETLSVDAPGVLDNDSDPFVIAVLDDPPDNGELTLNGDGSFEYTPDENFTGIDTFTYRDVDEFAAAESPPITVTIEVAALNDAPVAAADVVSTLVDTPVTINVVDGSAGGEDTDADGDSLTVLSVTPPDNGGTAEPAGDTIVYTPADGFVGEEMFEYTVADGNGGSDTASVSVTVSEPVKCAGKPVTVDLSQGQTPTEKADVIMGTSAAEVINGLGGNDTICGKGGNDTIRGGGGNDVIIGGGGNDVVIGGGGRDRLVGGAGKDKLAGGTGNDKLTGGKGKDRLSGNGGSDKLTAGKGNDKLFGGAGKDALNGGAGTDTCLGGAGADTLKKCEK